jgi:hypothetical protein
MVFTRLIPIFVTAPPSNFHNWQRFLNRSGALWTFSIPYPRIAAALATPRR